jgi:hypothetical protein
VAKTLKEALLEQMTELQERGLAPGEIPAEQEEPPSYAQYEGEGERRSAGRERDGESRRTGGGRAPRVRSRSPAIRQREHRQLREPRGGRERRPSRESRESRELPPELVGPPEISPSRPAPPPSQAGARPPEHPGDGRASRPAGTRPPFRPMGQPGPGGQNAGGPRPAPRSDMLRRNAERIQREQAERSEIQRLLASFGGNEMDDASLDQFFSQLAVETGALPPLNVVLEALRGAGSADPIEVGNQVRLHYRRARSRVEPTPVPVG